jgi:hypothetical protein
MDYLYPSLQQVPPSEIVATAGAAADGVEIRLVVEGETLEGDIEAKTVALPLGPMASGEERLEYAGLMLRVEDNQVLVDNVLWDSPAQQAGIDFDWRIKAIEMPLEQPAKYWIYLPVLLVLAFVIALQRRRRPALEATEQ